MIGPKPYQQKIPIYLGTFSLKALPRIIRFNANGWLAMPQMGMELFEKGKQYLIDEAKKQGRDPESVELPVLLAPEVTNTDLGTDRQLMNGSISEISHDIKKLEKLGVNHINLVFDFGSHAQDLKTRLDHAKQIQDSIAPLLTH